MATKKPGNGKWAFFGTVAVGTFLAVQTGWAGFGMAQLRSSVWPKDEAMLGWVPADTEGVVVIDPHQLELKSLGADGSTTRTAIERTRDDVKKATGIDLAFDMDKMVISPSLVVAKGRFDWKKLVEKLSEHGYAIADHNGEPYLRRAHEDAIAVHDDSILLYGDESAVEASIDAHKNSKSLEQNDQVKQRLALAGWNHPLLATVRINDDKPSLRAILTGATGPRAVSLGLGTLNGLDVDAYVEAASPASGAELAKLLEEKRKGAEAATPFVGPDAAPIVADAARKAVITSDPNSGSVKIHVHLDQAQVDTLAKSAKSAVPAAEIYKNMRLFQLLMPVP